MSNRSSHFLPLEPRLYMTAIALTMIIAAFLSAPRLRAADDQPRIWLSGPRALGPQYRAQVAVMQSFQSSGSIPLSLATEDFDQDGIGDLAVGYTTSEGGRIAIHRGNLDAFAPQSQASFEAIGRGDFPAPFLRNAQVIEAPVNPDFLAAGRFQGDGSAGLAVAARGDHRLYVLSGDGTGQFGTAQAIELPGAVTAMAAFTDGLYSRVLVGVHAGSASMLLEFSGSPDGLAPLRSVSLNADATSFAFGNLDGDRLTDAAVVAGGNLFVLRGSSTALEDVPTGLRVSSVALGSFVSDRSSRLQMAALGADGGVHILVRGEFDPTPYTPEELQAKRRQQRQVRGGSPVVLTETIPAPSERLVWKEVESLPAVADGEGVPLLMKTRISNNGADDAMTLSHGRLAVLAHPGRAPNDNTPFPTGSLMKRTESIQHPVAALSTRVNVDGRPGVVFLSREGIEPLVMMPLPDPTFFANRFDDPVPGAIASTCNNVSNVDISSSCSLREAIRKANAIAGTDTIMLAAGTYTLAQAKIPGNFTALGGTLDVTDSLNIIGTVDGSNNPTSIIQAGTTNADGVDKIFSFNQDITSFTTASVSISNLVLRFGRNRGDALFTQDGFGGAFDFDTGGTDATTATATLTITNCNITDNQTTDGEGGGFEMFNTNNGSGHGTITNSIVQNNTSLRSGVGDPNGTGRGGGIVLGNISNLVMTNTQVLNNKATQLQGTGIGLGGGIAVFGGSLTIHGGSISGNQTAGTGGGIYSEDGLTIDQGTIISNNTAGGQGGGIWFNGRFQAATLTKVTITGNSATGANGGSIGTGGGVQVDAGGMPLTISFSRLAGNSAKNNVGNNLANQTGAAPGSLVTATNNWWGTNSPGTTTSPSTSTCPGVAGTSGPICFDPFIVLTHTASPNKIRINQSTTLTADMSKDNHGSSAALSGNLDRIIGLPITFNNAVDGSITGAQATIQNNGMATATFNAGSVAGGGKADAVVDQATVTANIVVLQPPSIAKSFNPTKIVLNTGVSTLTFSVTNPNVVTIDSSFTDTFTSGMQVAATPNASNTCGGTWAPVAGATSVTFSNPALPVSGSPCTITVDVKGTIETTVNNSVTINSSDAGNGNTSSANLIVYVPPVLAIAKNHSGTFTQGQTATWTLQVTNNSSSATGTTDGTTVTVNDTLPTGYTLQSGAGTNWSCSGNGTNVATCTSSDVIAGNGGTFNLITLTVNVPANSPTSVQNTGKVFGGGDVVHTNLGNAATGSDTVTVIQVPASITINGSATQSAPLNTAFGSLAVTVKDAGNVTIPNYSSVVFTAPATGQSGTFDNATNTKTLPTNGSGIADPGTFTANGVPGAYTVDVAAGPAPHATFNLTNRAPDLTISKAHVGNGFTQGQQGAQYTLTVTNGGGVASSGTITVTDTLPSGLTFASGSGTGWSCSANGQAVTCTDAATPIAVSGNSTITLNVNVAANATTPLSNSATVACTCTESNTNNNTSTTDMVNVTQLPDLTISKSHVGNSFTQGQQGAQYTLVVNNGGSAASSGTITVTDTLPNGLTFASGSGTGWSCSANGQLVTCTDAATAIAVAGTSAITLNVNVAANAPNSAMNSAAVACTCAESNTNNNTSNTDTVTINTGAAANVTSQVTISNFLVAFNRTTGVWSQRVDVKNNGPGALSNAAYVLDSLNAGWTLTNGDGTTVATTPAGSPYKVLGAIAPNATVTVTLQFTRTGTPAFNYTPRVLEGTPR